MPWLAAAAPIVGGLAGKLIGGGGPKNAQPALPKDLQGMRGSNIGLMNYLLGFNQPNTPWNPQQQVPASQGGPIQRPGSTGIGQGGMPWQIGGAGGYGQQGGGNPRSMGGAGPILAAALGGGMGAGPTLGKAIGGGQAGPGGMPSFSMMGAPQGGQPQAIMDNFGGAGGGLAQGGGFGQAPAPSGTMPWSQMPQQGASDPSGMLGRMESYFGPLGTPTTALQQQSLGGISQFLNSNPYGQSNQALSNIMGSQGQDYFGGANSAFNKVGNANYFGGAQGAFNDVKGANYFGGAQNQANKVAGSNYFGKAQGAFDQLANGNYYGDANDTFKGLANYNPFGAAQTSLEGMLGANPGAGTMAAMDPLYQRALAQANQEGGRFGSANAILRSRALDDHALMMQQALQHGVDQQIAAAGQYGNIGNSLIGAKLGAGQGLLGVGQGRANQQTNAAQGYLGVGQGQLQQGLGAGNLMLGAGQGRLSQGLGAAQGLLGVGQGQLSQGLGAAQGLLGVGQGRSSYGLGLMGNQLQAAGQLANNQNSFFNNLQGGYGTGSAQADQEAQRQQQALQILLGQLGVSQGATLGAPTMVSPTGAQQGAQVGGQMGSILAQLYGGGAFGGGGGIPAAPTGFGAPDLNGINLTNLLT